MFTGLVQERGRIVAAPRATASGGRELWIGPSAELAERLPIGASLAVAGVCLTVVVREGTRCRVDLAPETLRRTTLGELVEGDEVNLEPALRVGDPLGGHWLQGHVDGLLRVTAIERLAAPGVETGAGEHREMAFDLPREWAPFVVEKGSVAIDGVSLTVAALVPGGFRVALIPHTLAITTLGRLVVGRRVHFEADILAKYVQSALAYRWSDGGAQSPG